MRKRDHVLHIPLKGLHRARTWVAVLVVVYIVAALHLSTLAGTLLLNLACREIVRSYLRTDDVMAPACVRDRYSIDSAAAYAVQSTRLLPGNHRAWLSLGRVRWLQGECQTALTTWRTSLDRFPHQSLWPRFELARSLYVLGERDKAVSLFKEVEAVGYLYGLARIRDQVGDPETARQLYELALDVEPLPGVADVLAARYAQQGEPELAAQVWQRVIAATMVDQPVHWLAMGQLAALKDDWLAARQAYEHAAAAPDHLCDVYLRYDLHLRLGRVLVKMEDLPDALEVYHNAIALRPRGSVEPYIAMGDIELRQGNYQAAVDWYDRAIAAFPGDPWPDIAAGDAAIEFDDPAEAERRYQTALALSPDHFLALVRMAWLRYRQGKRSEAIVYLERADPTSRNCGVLNWLEEWYRETGDMERAHQSAAKYANHCR